MGKYSLRDREICAVTVGYRGIFTWLPWREHCFHARPTAIAEQNLLKYSMSKIWANLENLIKKYGRNWTTFQKKWTLKEFFDRIFLEQNPVGISWKKLDKFGQIFLEKFDQIFWKNLNIFGQIWTNLDKFGQIWTNFEKELDN